MRSRISIILLLIALVSTGYLLWVQSRSVDLAITEHVQSAEAERHAYVVSHDFDLLKEKLIEVHRDHWVDVARAEQQARIGSILLAVICLIMITLLVRELRKKTPSP